jgi:hypothetical protein
VKRKAPRPPRFITVLIDSDEYGLFAEIIDLKALKGKARGDGDVYKLVPRATAATGKRKGSKS